MKTSKAPRIAYFVSPHGFGHAARASAVMHAIHDIKPEMHFEIFTSIPSWFFEDSIGRAFTHHPLQTDIGLIQKTPLYADLAGTVEALDHFAPFEEARINALAEQLAQRNCECVICDIAPMGIAAAREVGIPSVLVENFTWDWVYQEYLERHEGLRPHADYFAMLFSQADYHVQAEPVCSEGAPDLTVRPVSRRPLQSGAEVCRKLGIPDTDRMVLLTMGGVPEDYGFLRELPLPKGVWLVVPGASDAFDVSSRCIKLPHRSAFFHPDLIAAADGVVGKVGYSTLAEVYHGGAPFGFIKRPNFQESEILAAYIDKHMSGFAIEEERFRNGEWISRVRELVDIPRIQRKGPNGAEQIAAFVCAFIRH